MKTGRQASATVSKAICIRAVLAVRHGLSPVDDLTSLPPGIDSVSCVWKTQPEAQTNKLRITDRLVRAKTDDFCCDYPPLNRGYRIWGIHYTGLPWSWIWTFTSISISISISTEFTWISMDISISTATLVIYYRGQYVFVHGINQTIQYVLEIHQLCDLCDVCSRSFNKKGENLIERLKKTICTFKKVTIHIFVALCNNITNNNSSLTFSPFAFSTTGSNFCVCC